MARRGTKTAGNGEDTKTETVDSRLVVEKGTGAHFVATTQENGLVGLVPVTLKTAEQFADGYKAVE